MTQFNFYGFGNFSTDFGWDNGLSVSVETEGTTTKAPIGQVVVEFSNTHGGSRNVDGTVTATSYDEAIRIMNNWVAENYPEREW